MLIQNTVEDDSGKYECVAINQIGEARCEAVATIETPQPQPKPTAAVKKEDDKAAIVQPLQNVTANEGQPAQFSCQITGKPRKISD